jgi:quercetin dioxygenase-like cupin family protein
MVQESSDIRGKAMKLQELVEYQKASIVSRTIVDKKAGTVTLFAFDEGEGLSEHTAPYDALVVDLDGEAEVSIEEKSSRLAEGDMIMMPANRPHALRALTRFKMMLVMVKAE